MVNFAVDMLLLLQGKASVIPCMHGIALHASCRNIWLQTVVEVQNKARHVLRIALVLWLSRQHLNRPGNSGEATK
jgi:hypothetical protein